MIRLYPKVVVKGQSFHNVKKSVVPNQSMTLKEIIKRFIKHESLPIIKEGTYSDKQDIDLEKFVHEDITVRHDMVEEHKKHVKGMKDDLDKQNKTALQKARDAKKAEQDELFDRLKKDQTPSDPKA